MVVAARLPARQAWMSQACWRRTDMRQLTDVCWRHSQHAMTRVKRASLHYRLTATTSDLAECGGRGRGGTRGAVRVRSRPVRRRIVRRSLEAVQELSARRLAVVRRRLAAVDGLALRDRLLRPQPGPVRAFR